MAPWSPRQSPNRHDKADPPLALSFDLVRQFAADRGCRPRHVVGAATLRGRRGGPVQPGRRFSSESRQFRFRGLRNP